MSINIERTGIRTLASLLKSESVAPLLLLGAGASFRSGVPLATEAVRQIARTIYSKLELQDSRPAARVKPSEWEPWLQAFPWFISDAGRFAENFPLVVDHLLRPADVRKRILLDLMQPHNGLSNGYKIVADFVMRGLLRTILTTNFDTCIRDALLEKHPHIRNIAEVNRSPGDYAEFDLFSKCQIIWLHGKAEQYSDKNGTGEVNSLDSSLLQRIQPLLNDSPLIVVGYRGAEPSIMESLLGKSGDGRLDFPKGVFWCHKADEPLHPNVEAFSRRLGSNFTPIPIKGFDELFADLASEVGNFARYDANSAHIKKADLSFDEKSSPNATLEDLDLDLALTILAEYCRKLNRGTLSRDTLLPLMREQGLIIKEGDTDRITNAAILLFGKTTQHFFPHAVIALTEAGKKRQVFEGNLLSQHRQLLDRLEQADINPVIKAKKQRQHEERPSYPQRALVELLVNLIVHRDYEVEHSATVTVHPLESIVFTNPGVLLPQVAQHTQKHEKGSFILAKGASQLRNPAIADIFFGISAMEREGTGILDVSRLMAEASGYASFYNKEDLLEFSAHLIRQQASAGSESVAYPSMPIGVYLLNVMPFSLVPENISLVRLNKPIREISTQIDLTEVGTFITYGTELWSFVPLPIITVILDGHIEAAHSRVVTRTSIESDKDSRRILTWLLGKHWEQHLRSFSDQGLWIEKNKSKRAYFIGREVGNKSRTITWNSPQKRNIRREVVKNRTTTAQRPWFENEGFGYEIVQVDNIWCVRIKPFYMFTGGDACKPLPPFTRTAKATRRMKFDRNKSVESDLYFWSAFLGREQPTINLGQRHVDDLILQSTYLTVEVVEPESVANEN